MAATLVTAFAGEKSLGPESRRSGRMSEIWKVTSASASVGDTGTLTPYQINKVEGVIGLCSWLIADFEANTITVKTGIALANTDVINLEIIGYP